MLGVGKYSESTVRARVAASLGSDILCKWSIRSVQDRKRRDGYHHQIRFDCGEVEFKKALVLLQADSRRAAWHVFRWTPYHERQEQHRVAIAGDAQSRGMDQDEAWRYAKTVVRQKREAVSEKKPALVQGELKFMQININGQKNFNSVVFRHLVHKEQVEVVAMQELYGGRFQNKMLPKFGPKMKSYQMYVSPYVEGDATSHGVALAISKDIQSREYGDPTTTMVAATVDSVAGPALWISLYVPQPQHRTARKRALREARQLMDSFSRKFPDSKIFLLADANCDAKEMDGWLSKGKSKATRADTGPCPTGPARIIDYVATRNVAALQVKVIEDVKVSDHKPILGSANIQRIERPPPKPVATRIVNNEHFRLFGGTLVKSKHWKDLQHLLIEDADYVNLTPAQRAAAEAEVDVPAEEEEEGVHVEEEEEEEEEEELVDPTTGFLPARLIPELDDRCEKYAVDLQQKVDDLAEAVQVAALRAAEEVGLSVGPPAPERRFRVSGELKRLMQISRCSYKQWSQALKGSVGGKWKGKRVQLYLEDYQKKRQKVDDCQKKEEEKRFRKKASRISAAMSSGDARESWREINELCGRGKGGGSEGAMKNHANEVKSSQNEKLQIWGEYVEGLFADTNGQSRQVHLNEDLLRERASLGKVCKKLHIDETLSFEDFVNGVWEAKNGKAPGRSGVHVLALKACCPTRAAMQAAKSEGREIAPENEMARLIFSLARCMFLTGTLPSEYRKALLVFIHKKDDRMVCSNYRGISLIESLLKVVTSIVWQRVQASLESVDFFLRSQVGFRKGEEAMSQVITLFEVCRARKCMTQLTWLVFLDMRKAYDSCDHAKMLLFLAESGVDPRGLIFQFFVSLYRLLEMATKVGMDETEFKIQLRGLRQGCSASPGLFLIFVNSIFDKAKAEGLGIDFPKLDASDISSGFIDKLIGLLFADDAVLIADSCRDARRLVKCVEEWAKVMGMVFNASKSAVMVVCPAGVVAPVGPSYQISIGGVPVKRVKVYTYLGVAFNDALCLEDMVKARAE